MATCFICGHFHIFSPVMQWLLRKNWLLPAVCLLAGLLGVLLTRRLIGDYEFGNGKPLLAFYIPLPVSIVFLCVSCWKNRCTLRTVFIAIALFIVSVSPLYNYFSQTYRYDSRDDGYRYRVMANNIAGQKTLWGSDDLVYKKDKKVYMAQPAYRYYLAAWLAVAGKETRLYQVMNMLVYLLAVSLLLVKLRDIELPEKFRKGFLLFLALSAPFVTKLIMLGLMEWLVIVIFILTLYSYLSGKMGWTVFLLALLPFFRQNLLIFSLLIFLWLLLSLQQRWKYVLLYVVILLLPIYHNLYYAGQWKFFSTYYHTSGYFILLFKGSFAMQVIKTFLYHVALYGGVDWLMKNFWSNNILSLSFIPLGTCLYVYCIYKCKGQQRWIYLPVTLSAIVPTLILGGNAYYPRFEWVNLMLAMLFYIQLYKDKKQYALVDNMISFLKRLLTFSKRATGVNSPLR